MENGRILYLKVMEKDNGGRRFKYYALMKNDMKGFKFGLDASLAIGLRV